MESGQDAILVQLPGGPSVPTTRDEGYDAVHRRICEVAGGEVALQYLDDEGDLITVGSAVEWDEALNFCDPDGTLRVSLSWMESCRGAAPGPNHAAEVDEPCGSDAAHPAAVGTISCRAIPRRVSRAAIMRRNPQYKVTEATPVYPPVVREMPVAGEDDDWELLDVDAPLPTAEVSKPAPSGSVKLKVNGISYTVPAPEPEAKLVDFLRKDVGLAGSKIGCGEGGCGACTVLLHFADHVTGKMKTKHINSCLRPLAACDGLEVSTVESVGTTDHIHPLQKKLAENNGSQCGLCTPGWIMAMMGLLADKPNPTPQQVEDHFDGNICRCTGYRPILDTMHSFAGVEAPAGGCGGCGSSSDVKAATAPAALTLRAQSGAQWLRPASLEEALQLRGAHSGSRLVGGNTGIGVEKYYNKRLAFDSAATYIDISRLPELNSVQPSASGLTFGSAVPINEMVESLQKAHAASPTTTATFGEVARHALEIANNQVRNVGTWAGNLMIACKHTNFPSDLLTCFSAAGATLLVASAAAGKRTVSVVDFAAAALAADGTALKDDELIESITLPFKQSASVKYNSWKVMPRHQNAHAYINGAALVEYSNDGKTVKNACLTFGGLGPGLRVAHKTAAFLVGKSFDAATLKGALAQLEAECTATAPPPNNPNPGVVSSPLYRQKLCVNLFYKFFLSQLPGKVPQRMQSAVGHYERAISKGTGTYQSNPATAPLAMPVTKLEAYSQTTGEAKYTDDIPQQARELCAAYVLSEVAAGVIASIDASHALAAPGVVDFVSAKDVTDLGCANECGGFPGDEEIFASKQVYCCGQAVGLVVADSLPHAQAAAKLVKVSYHPLPAKPILSIEEAIAANSFITMNTFDTGHIDKVESGDCTKGFASAKHVVSGVVSIGAQEHFYMETQAAVAIPEEDGRWTVHSSCQGPASIRQTLTGVLQIPGSRINVSCKRAGGGFGGKITGAHPMAAAVVVAAKKLRRPVRMQLSRNDDLIMTGKRHPYKNNYKVGFDDNGKISSLQVTFYSMGGYCHDASLGCMDMTMMWADNCYYFENYSIVSNVCRTNHPSNTACRTPGAAQGIFTIECVLDHVAAGAFPYHL